MNKLIEDKFGNLVDEKTGAIIVKAKDFTNDKAKKALLAYSEGKVMTVMDRIMATYEYEDKDEFLSDFFADALYSSYYWLDSMIPEVKDPNAQTIEDSLLYSVKRGKLHCITDEGEDIFPTYESFFETVNKLYDLGYGNVADEYIEEYYDAYSTDSLLQLWLLGDVIYG